MIVIVNSNYAMSTTFFMLVPSYIANKREEVGRRGGIINHEWKRRGKCRQICFFTGEERCQAPYGRMVLQHVC